MNNNKINNNEINNNKINKINNIIIKNRFLCAKWAGEWIEWHVSSSEGGEIFCW